MQLRDFCVHRFSSIAKLEEAHVVALRLYSTAAFRSINTPLRELASGERVEPHHLPVTVAFLDEGVKKLRAVMAGATPAPDTPTVTSMADVTLGERSAAGGSTASLRAIFAASGARPSTIDNEHAYATPPKVLYRGMRDVVLPTEFFEKGGTVRSLLLCPYTGSLHGAIRG